MAFKKKETSSNNLNTRSVFVGRKHELAFFINNVVKADDISHNIIAISGNGGVGKSSLLARFMEEAKASNYKHTCLTALINEQKTTPAAILEAFADQLTQSGYPLTEFDKALAEYKETLRRIRADRELGGEVMLRSTMDLAGSILGEAPGVGKAVEKMTKSATDMYLKERKTRQLVKDAERLEDPIGALTKAFIEDLNKIAETPHKDKRNRRIFLFFDTFE